MTQEIIDWMKTNFTSSAPASYIISELEKLEMDTEISDEEIAINFAEWIRINDFEATTKNTWVNLDLECYTTKELYDKWYKEQLKNKL